MAQPLPGGAAPNTPSVTVLSIGGEDTPEDTPEGAPEDTPKNAPNNAPNNAPTKQGDSPYPFTIGPDAEGFRSTPLSDWLTSNLRFSLDLSSRVIANTDNGEFATENFVGFDIHKVLTNPAGDWGTLTLQGFLTRIDNQPDSAPFFEGDDDWEFVYRIFNFNYTGIAPGRFNVRIGHFDIPFGLEPTLNTNGTLRQLTHASNLGFVTDWGVTVNGLLNDVEYEVGLSRGTGNEWTSRGDPFVAAGRVGRAIDPDLSVGLSGFFGEVLIPSDFGPTLQRLRFGADVSYRFGPFTLLGELSIGRDEDQDVVNAFIELDWQNPRESVLLYSQFKSFNQNSAAGWENAFAAVLGLRYAIDNHWTLSGQWTQDFTTFASDPRQSGPAVQLRYRF